jgi:hypothetical protein
VIERSVNNNPQINFQQAASIYTSEYLHTPLLPSPQLSHSCFYYLPILPESPVCPFIGARSLSDTQLQWQRLSLSPPQSQISSPSQGKLPLLQAELEGLDKQLLSPSPRPAQTSFSSKHVSSPPFSLQSPLPSHFSTTSSHSQPSLELTAIARYPQHCNKESNRSPQQWHYRNNRDCGSSKAR